MRKKNQTRIIMRNNDNCRYVFVYGHINKSRSEGGILSHWLLEEHKLPQLKKMDGPYEKNTLTKQSHIHTLTWAHLAKLRSHRLPPELSRAQ